MRLGLGKGPSGRRDPEQDASPFAEGEAFRQRVPLIKRASGGMSVLGAEQKGPVGNPR